MTRLQSVDRQLMVCKLEEQEVIVLLSVTLLSAVMLF